MNIYRLPCIIWILVMSLAVTCYGKEIEVFTEQSLPGGYSDETGYATGPTVEMVRELMRRLNLKGDIRILPWKRGYRYLLAGPKVALFETTRTEEREQLFKWVGPIKRVRWVFFAKKSAKIKLNSLEDAMKFNTICIYLGDAKGEYLKRQGFTNIFQPVSSKQCLNMLKSNRTTLWVASDTIISSLLKETGMKPSEFEIIHLFGTKYLYIALSIDVPDEVVELWQKTLDEMKLDGTLASFYKGTYADEMIQAISVPEQPSFTWNTGKEDNN